ncbi:MAG: response regulator, partial [Gammaproteobacteria bacterium]|nr:response regulator [Gammaproteobacteria bacterium]
SLARWVYGTERACQRVRIEDIHQRVHDADRHGLLRAWRQALEQGTRLSQSYRVYDESDDLVWVREDAEAELDPGGRVNRLAGTVQDITNSKRVEEALRLSERLLEDGIEAMPVGFAIYDAEERLVLCNDSYRATFPKSRHLLKSGLRFEDLVRASAPDVAAELGFDDPESYVSWRMDSFRNGAAPWVLRQSNGRWIETYTRRSINGRYISVRADISERKHLEEQLQRAQRLDAVAGLTAGIAHELNNLLAVVQGNTDLLRGHAAHAHGFLESISKAVGRGAELTQRLLAFSRRQSLHPEHVELGQWLHDMAGPIEQMLHESIDVQVQVEPDLWAVAVDPGQLENALMSLVINARAAMPAGGELIVSAWNVAAGNESEGLDPQQQYVAVCVADTGAGMSAEVRNRAFEPFFSTKGIGEASGLGLSSVYGFAHQSGGTASLESALGAGTSVTVLLPRHAEQASPPSSKERPPRVAGRRVLVVEDDPVVREVLVAMLEFLDLEVSVSESVTEARDVMSGGLDFDLVLSDVVMPGESGTDFARELRQTRPGVPVVLMSGYSPEHFAAHTRNLDPEALPRLMLRKPFTLSFLTSAVHDALSG